MADKTAHQKDKAKKSTRSKPKSRQQSGALEFSLSPDRLSDLPEQSNAQPARLAAVLQLQRQLGNAVVQHQIARQEEEEAPAVKLPNPKSLTLEKELEGHPFGPTVQREDDAGEEALKTPSAAITLKLKDPKIKRLSEKKIQERHGKEGIAGYTKPKIKFSVSELKQYEIKVTVTISFVMDLAKEFKGGRLQVLRDHENAHILIAEKVANEFVLGPLKDDLEALPDYSNANKPQIQTAFGEKYQDFSDNEGDESEAFDDIDYPRMKEAYYGVKTPLADLSSGSAGVKKVVDTIDAFNDGGKAAAADAETLGGLIQPLVEAQDALGEDDLSRLQYNADFKKKVASAQKIVAGLNKKPDTLAEGVKTKLDELSPALEKFTWQPEIS